MRVCRSRRRRYSLIVRVGTWRRSRSSLSHSFLFLFFFCWIDPLSRHSLQIFRCVFSFLSFVSLRNGILLHCALHSWHRPLYHMTRPLQGFHGSLQYGASLPHVARMNYHAVFGTINLGTKVQVSWLSLVDEAVLCGAFNPVARKHDLHITHGDQETIPHCCTPARGTTSSSCSYRIYKTT